MPGLRDRKTPGVYVTEIPAFPPSAVGVETAIPAFVGYTERAEVAGRPAFNTPIPMNSIDEYHTFFGGPCRSPIFRWPCESSRGPKGGVGLPTPLTARLHTELRRGDRPGAKYGRANGVTLPSVAEGTVGARRKAAATTAKLVATVECHGGSRLLLLCVSVWSWM